MPCYSKKWCLELLSHAQSEIPSISKEFSFPIFYLLRDKLQPRLFKKRILKKSSSIRGCGSSQVSKGVNYEEATNLKYFFPLFRQSQNGKKKKTVKENLCVLVIAGY